MRRFVGYVSILLACLMFMHGIFGSTPDVHPVAHFLTGWFLASMFTCCACWLLRFGKEIKPELVTVTTNTSAVVHKQLVCKNCGGSEIKSVEL